MGKKTNSTPTVVKPEPTVAIKPTVLGRKLAEYKRLEDAKVPADRVTARMEEDAQMFGITLEDYRSRLAELKNKSTTGKRAELKEKKSAIQTLHMDICSRLNEVIVTGNTDVAELQTALKDLGSQGDGWVLMTAIEKDEPSGECLFTINDRGWNDGSKRQNQYSDRPQPVGKSVKGTNPTPEIHGV
jgi:hypothetical protein